MQPTLSQAGAELYRFQEWALDSQDGARHYRIYLAIPQRPAPEAGYPVLYLLDGNAAFSDLDADALTAVAPDALPVLVAIGYQTDLRFDIPARIYDYTLPGGESEDARGRRQGGADAFLDLLQGTIRPEVERRVTVDPQRQTLWGHSFGGLLVLHTLFTRPDSFTAYVAASPSLWWAPELMAREERAFAARERHDPKRLLLLVGEKEDASRRAPGFPDDAAEQLASRLDALSTLEVHFETLPGLSHGPMLTESLPFALRWAVGQSLKP